MAKRTSYLLVDDIDGAELDSADGSSVSFGIDGVTYEIDLSNANAEQLREALAPYISAGRRGGGKPAKRRSARSSLRTDEIRAWGREQGYTVSDRGRIPQAVVRAYNAA